MRTAQNASRIRWVLIAVLLLFGGLTLFLSTSVLFDLFGMREKEGNYVQFVVLANFFAAIFYLVAAFGLMYRKLWTRYPLWMASVIMIGTSLGLAWYVSQGGLHEPRTIVAMIFRTILTSVFYFTAVWIGRSQQQHQPKPSIERP